MDAENSQLEAMLAGYGPRGRTILLEMLHDAQAIYGGWLPRPAIERIAEFLDIPVADIYGVTEFYEMFHTEPVGRQVIRVCQDGPCAVAGAAKLTEELAARLGIRPGETTPDGAYTIEAVRCLGLCDRAPAALVNLERHAPAAVETLLDGQPLPAKLRIGGLVKIALAKSPWWTQPAWRITMRRRDVGVSQGDSRADAGASDRRDQGQQAAGPRRRSVFGRAEMAVCRQQPAPRYIICNVDESEAVCLMQELGADGRGPVPGHRGAADRQLRHRRF